MAEATLFGFFIIFYLAILGVAILLSFAIYLVTGLSCMKLAKKVGIKNGWLGFVPIGDIYLMGKFAEKDNEIYHPEGKQRKWSKIMLYYSIIFWSIFLLFYLGCLVAMLIISLTNNGYPELPTTALIITPVALLLFAAALAMIVLQYIVMYKTLHLMVRDHAWWILLLIIFVTSSAYQIALVVFAFSKNFPTYLQNAEGDSAEDLSAQIPQEIPSEQS